MDDPASRVPPNLLQHLHCLADHLYPAVQTASLELILEKLKEAPSIVQSIRPLTWKFLDCPPNGSLFLEYQSPSTQNKFASDGYFYADAESYHRQEHNGYLIELLLHNFGFAPGREDPQGLASHARRRYRLVPNPNNPSYECNTNLWIVHYQYQDQMFPAARIRPGPNDLQSYETRRWLQAQGQLMDNKFMLGDRGSWPTIAMPNSQPHHRVPGPIIGFAGRTGHPAARQQMVQPPGYSVDHPPKRVRHNPGAARVAAPKQPVQPQPSELQEEEDYRDLHDLMNQRDISQNRYIQHHEWMEELYSSYPTFAIKPVSLGLGRKGELEPLTNGFFDPPRPPTPEDRSANNDDAHYDTTIQKPLEPGKAEEFYELATKKIEEINKEIEEMKLSHAERMESFSKLKDFREAEKSLRGTVAASEEGVNSEATKVDGGLSQMYNPASGDATIAALRQMEQIDNVAKEVENLTGKKITKLDTIKLLQKGGLIEEAAPPPEKSRSGSGINTGGDMGSIFDDFLEPGAGERSLLGSNQPSTKPSASPQTTPGDTDRPMTGQADGAADDWVMVDKQDSQPQAGATATSAPTATAGAATIYTPTAATTNAPTQESAAASKLNDNNAELGADLVDFGDDEPNSPIFEGGAFDDAIDFGDLDNGDEAVLDLDAGDPGGMDMDIPRPDGNDNALGPDMSAVAAEQIRDATDGDAGGSDGQARVQVADVSVQGQPGGETIVADNDEADHGAMDLMEDSAFGDAFHHTEAEAQE